MRNIKAIFINAHERTVTDVEIPHTLHAIYETIGCDVIEIINLGGKHLLIVDEEGRLKEQTVGFQLPKMPGIAGNALVVCHDEDGEFADVQAPRVLFDICVDFLDLKKNPLPPPTCTFTQIKAMTPEGIAKAREEAERGLRANC